MTHICVAKLTIIGSNNGLLSKFKPFYWRKSVWKCHLRNVVHFVSALICLFASSQYSIIPKTRRTQVVKYNRYCFQYPEIMESQVSDLFLIIHSGDVWPQYVETIIFHFFIHSFIFSFWSLRLNYKYLSNSMASVVNLTSKPKACRWGKIINHYPG